MVTYISIAFPSQFYHLQTSPSCPVPVSSPLVISALLQPKMVSYITRLALAALALPAVFAAPAPQPHLLKIRDSNAKEIIKDSYIVVYNNDISAASISSHEAHFSNLLSRRSLTGVGATYHMAHLKGYQVTADLAAIAEIAASPDVSSHMQ